MSTQELKAKYGVNKNSTRLINAAIRAELPGGNQALDALERARAIGNEAAIELVSGIVEAMAAEIRQRYGLPPREE